MWKVNVNEVFRFQFNEKQMSRLDINWQLSLAPWNNVTVVRVLSDSNFLYYIESNTVIHNVVT